MSSTESPSTEVSRSCTGISNGPPCKQKSHLPFTFKSLETLAASLFCFCKLAQGLSAEKSGVVSAAARSCHIVPIPRDRISVRRLPEWVAAEGLMGGGASLIACVTRQVKITIRLRYESISTVLSKSRSRGLKWVRSRRPLRRTIRFWGQDHATGLFRRYFRLMTWR